MNFFLKRVKKYKDYQCNKEAHYRGAFYFALFLSLFPCLALADVVTVLDNFLSYLTGDVGKAIAAIAIVGVGFGCFALGKIPKSYMVAVVVGIAIIFSAQTILGMMTA